ncbi:MAG: hypothetical protein ACRDMA_12795 [Solirubrobacterales bacterium]
MTTESFSDLFPAGELKQRVDALSEPSAVPTFDRAVYRLGYRSMGIAGFPETVPIGDIRLFHVIGPVRTQLTAIQQRPGLDLAFDKHMESSAEVGDGQWLTIVQIDSEPTMELTQAMAEWRGAARAAMGVVCAVLDDRIAQEQLFEDVILFHGSEPYAVADRNDLVRHYLPYQATETELQALHRLAELGSDDEGNPAVRAARWYLRAIELGPTAEAVIFMWCAIEAFAPEHSKKTQAIEALLNDAGWDPELLELPLRRLVALRGDIVHRGIDDPEELRSGYYRLEAIVRVLLRHHLGLDSTWPEVVGVNLFLPPADEQVAEGWARPSVIFHEDGLPEPDAAEEQPVTWERIERLESDGGAPTIDVGGHLEAGWGRRVRTIAREVTRSLALHEELPEITIMIENPEGAPPEIRTAVGTGRIAIRPRVLGLDEPERTARLIWELEAAIMQHALMRRGVPSDGGFGTLLLELAGGWAQHHHLMCAGGAPELLTYTEIPLEGDPDSALLGGHLGAALAGSTEAKAVLDRWTARSSDDAAAPMVEGVLAEWEDVDSATALLDRAADAFQTLQG